VLGKRYVRGFVVALCLVLALAVTTCTTASPTSLPSPTTEATARGATVSLSAVQTPTVQASVLPAATHTPVTGTPTSTPIARVVIEPLAVAAARLGLAFDGWSPDGQWIAYWVGDVERPAHLTFVDVHTGRTCQHEEVSAQDWSRRVIWQGDGKVTAVINQQGEALGGLVCEALAPVEAVAFPGRVTGDEMSPDGRYRALTRIVRWEGEAMYKTLVIAEVGTGRMIASVSYVGSPHFGWAGQGWLNEELYLIGKAVDQGILYVSLPEGRIGHVLPDMVGPDTGDEEYIWLVQSQADPANGAYHLLLQEYRDDAPQFPLLLYHSELDQVEEVPFYLAWPFFDSSSFTPDGTWLLLGNPTAKGEPVGAVNYWLRPVDPPGSTAVEVSIGMKLGGVSAEAQKMAEIVAKAVTYGWAFCGLSREAEQMAFSRETSVMVFGLSDGKLLGGWSTSPYNVRYLWWSPDGNHAVAMGYDAQTENEALFVIPVPAVTGTVPVASATGTDVGRVIFTVPVGPEGVQYGPNYSGPAALAAAPDGTFWIGDTVGNRLLHYDSRGILLSRIDLSGYGVVGLGDVTATDAGILVLDIAAPVPRVLHLTGDGLQVAAYALPEGLRVEDGLTGLDVGDQGEILVEREGGALLSQLVNARGVLEPLPLQGYTHQGRLYKTQLADGRESHGSITAGDARIEVSVSNVLAGLRILGFTPADELYVVVEEMTGTRAVSVDQTVRLYGPAGELLGLARVPVAEQHTYVQHGLAVGRDGAVYALLTRPDHVEVVRLSFAAELPPILPARAPCGALITDGQWLLRDGTEWALGCRQHGPVPNQDNGGQPPSRAG
jgi:hypothetical protein